MVDAGRGGISVALTGMDGDPGTMTTRVWRHGTVAVENYSAEQLPDFLDEDGCLHSAQPQPTESPPGYAGPGLPAALQDPATAPFGRDRTTN